MNVEHQTLNLPCQLTPEQMSAKASALVEHEDQMLRLEKDLAEYKATIKEGIDGHKAETTELRRAIRTKSEYLDVDCLVIPLPNSGTIVTIRTDTAAEVSRRPMTDNEKMQPNLFDATPERDGDEEIVRDPHSHLIQAVTLNDIMFQLDIDLAPSELVLLSDSDLDKARNWSLKTLNIKEDDERKEKAKKPPKFLQELLTTVEEKRAAAVELAQLQQRCLGLLMDAGEVIEPTVVEGWDASQLCEASDFAQLKLDGKEPVRPVFMGVITALDNDAQDETEVEN